jgi:hypothetical protein
MKFALYKTSFIKRNSELLFLWQEKQKRNRVEQHIHGLRLHTPPPPRNTKFEIDFTNNCASGKEDKINLVKWRVSAKLP